MKAISENFMVGEFARKPARFPGGNDIYLATGQTEKQAQIIKHQSSQRAESREQRAGSREQEAPSIPEA